MLYLSKGIAEKDSTENLIKVRRGDYTYTVSGNAAKLWLAGRFGFAACDTDEEISDILNLTKIGLAEYETEECTDKERVCGVSHKIGENYDALA